MPSPSWTKSKVLILSLFLALKLGDGLYIGESSFELYVKEMQITYEVKKE